MRDPGRRIAEVLVAGLACNLPLSQYQVFGVPPWRPAGRERPLGKISVKQWPLPVAEERSLTSQRKRAAHWAGGLLPSRAGGADPARS